MELGKVTITSDAYLVRIDFEAAEIYQPGRALFIAIDTDPLQGCAVIPYAQHAEGSTVFLPFRANRLYAVRIGGDGQPGKWQRRWTGAEWTNHGPTEQEIQCEATRHRLRVTLPRRVFPALPLNAATGTEITLAVWAKDLNQNDGWGSLLPAVGDAAGWGDRALGACWRVVHPAAAGAQAHSARLATRATLHATNAPRPRIYQLLPRVFSNTNETRQPNGTLAENGVGKFADLSDLLFSTLRDDLGITHVWLTGVLAQATSTGYAAIGKPADDPDLLKGLAGSPYAIKDYGEVCADYALHPARRMEEFRAVLDRAHAAGLQVIIDFVPNHVARCHHSSIVTFGQHDDPARFFDPRNNYFWLQPGSPGGGPPLRLPTVCDGQFVSPTCAVLGAGDGLFAPETAVGRVTGNNAATWAPSMNDWYETVKLNYGFDFTTGARAYPCAGAPDAPVPDTWVKMDQVLAHWQELGVDGFRCDMAHMVPPEFWAWAIARARARRPGVYFLAEAYNNDPMKVEGAYDLLAHFHNVMIELLNAGFDAVYDDPAYKTLKALYDGSAWANDIDGTLAAQGPCVFPCSLRYAENHDEVRLAGRGQWGGVGMEVGRPVSGILFGLSRGPVLLYSGQEVGEPADGLEGFGGDDARTTIFDYWSMPEVVKWVNGHRYDGARLSPAQKELRAFYGRLLKACGEPAFQTGEFFPLNGANKDNPHFGRLGESASGHWLYAYVRADVEKHSAFLVVANLHRSETMRDVRVRFSVEAAAALPAGTLEFTDLVGGLPSLCFSSATLTSPGALFPELPPLSAAYFQIRRSNR